VLLSSLLLVPYAAALPFLTVDQRNDDFTTSGPGQDFSLRSPFGQEFTPALAALDGVHIPIGPRDPATVAVVNIRGNTIAGPIIGTSLPGIIGPPGTPENRFIQFDFSDRVPLAPGDLYVIEVKILSGGGEPTFNFLPVINNENLYPGGRLITLGNPIPGSDLAFREGLVVPEPGTVSLLSIGLLGLVGGVVRRRRASERKKRLYLSPRASATATRRRCRPCCPIEIPAMAKLSGCHRCRSIPGAPQIKYLALANVVEERPGNPRQ
jgi:hypothetical protein